MKAKKLISAAMALILVCGAPVVSYGRTLIQMQASSADYTTEHNDDYCYYKYSDHIELIAVRGNSKSSLESIEFPSEIDGLPVTMIKLSGIISSIGSVGSEPAKIYEPIKNFPNLTTIIIPNSVTTIGNSAFSGCIGLTSITIPDSVTNIGTSAFSGCTGLTSITIPDSVTMIGNSAFSGCIGLTSITIPDSVTTIENSAFSGCTGLKSITIPNSIKSISYSAFGKCTGLTSITIPDSVTTIGSSAFSGCTGLTSITIPESIITIGSSAFSDCTSLTSVTIPESVTSVKDNAFVGCTNLTSLVIKNPKCELSATMTGFVLPFTIYGYKNSTAQAYALSKGMDFVAIDADEPQTTPSAGKADVNGDGKADASDASDILRYYAHLSTGGKLSFEEFIKK